MREKRGIRKTIAYSSMLIAGLFMLVFAISFILLANNQVLQQNVQATSYNLDLASNYINTNLNNIRNLAIYCSINSSLRIALNSDSSALWLSTFDDLQDTMQSNPSFYSLERIVITDSNFSRFMHFGGDISSSRPLNAYTLGREFPEAVDTFSGVFNSTLSFSPHLVISLREDITDYRDDETLGYVYATVSLSRLFSTILSYEDELMIKIGDEYYVYHSNRLERIDSPLLDSEDISRRFSSITDSKVYKAGSYYAVEKDCGVGNISIIRVFESPSVFEGFTAYVLIFFLIFLFIFILGRLLSEFLNNIFYQPLQKILKRLGKIKEGDFSKDRELERDDEFGLIGDGINELTDAIEDLMEKRIQDEKSKMELEYKMLLSQINPHFLYNTLNSIKWMATLQKADGIAEMVTSLSRLMKVISKASATLVPFSEEIAFIDDYIVIMKYRYGNTVTYYKNIDESLANFFFPRFSLQPLVENSIFHGLEPKGEGAVAIIAKDEGDYITIAVIDNGAGFSKIEEKEDKNGGMFKQIGLENIKKRLEYSYPGRVEFSIESKENVYTKNTIRIKKES